ncbi:MAG: cytochrome C554 [Pirellulaceae bacterium]|nr:cytochrome C554 [Pirellulaceae bacterium]
MFSVVGHLPRVLLACTLICALGWALGCAPEKSAEQSSQADTNASKPADGIASEAGGPSTAKSAANSTNAPSMDEPGTNGAKAAQGPITVNPEGFVTLGTVPAPVEPAPTKPAVTEPASAEPSALTRAPEVDKAATRSAGNASSTEAKAKDSRPPAPESGLATFDEKNQQIAVDWPKPQAVLFLTGQQHGYIEPCGCTGLENQKGGLNRRDTLMTQLRERGWDLVPMDVGNFERRTGQQAEIKFQTTVEALNQMQYRAATLGVDDLKLSSTHLMALTASEGKTQTPFISANAYIVLEEFMPKSRIIEVGGRKIGVTAVLGDGHIAELKDYTDVITAPAAQSLRKVLEELKAQKCDYLVLLAHASLEESQQLARDVPGFDLVVSAGGFPEPQYQLEEIEGSTTKLTQVGAKGMFSVLVGLYPDKDVPVRYQRVALSSQFADSPRMLKRFGEYQKRLESLGFDGLKVPVQALEDDLKFVGSESCGDCHSKAYQVWKDSEHFTATESLVNPPNSRSMIPRHFDPECLSCHVTGWNPQKYYPYSSGFASLEKTPSLTGNGCENCHGAGSAHVAAENGDIQADDALLKTLREKMRLPLAEARDHCARCHDQDNSPDFQHEGAFEEYWQQIAHPGKD